MPLIRVFRLAGALVLTVIGVYGLVTDHATPRDVQAWVTVLVLAVSLACALEPDNGDER